jgi:hypothetical protein
MKLLSVKLPQLSVTFSFLHTYTYSPQHPGDHNIIGINFGDVFPRWELFKGVQIPSHTLNCFNRESSSEANS